MYRSSIPNELAQRLDALSRSQAMIEFGLDGVIRTANDNFLEVMGYALDEIVGKHHSMFVTLPVARSPEYAAFWQRLAAGEFQAGVYRRLDREGRDVWIQASYNPILDEQGRPTGVLKSATDVTAERV
ncbi:MAG: PAS domain-containing protein, partial [Myxococcota bacterium]